MLISDTRGRVFDDAHAPQRIVSLVPSVTQALYEFGAGGRIVGVTDYCILPSDGVAKARVGGTKNPRVEQILSLQPDLIIGNVEENSKSAVEALEAQGVPVFVMFPCTVRGAIEELRTLGQLVQAEDSDSIIAPMERALANIRVRPYRPRVFVPIWRDPWMTANGETYISDLIETCGGENIFRDRARMFPLAADLRLAPARMVQGQDTRYPRVSLDEVAAREPEVILLPDEPYRFTDRDADELRGAFPQARVHGVDGTLVSWHGIRLAQALETISGLLHGS